MIIGELWHRAKKNLGSRNSRKTGTRGRHAKSGISAVSRVRQEYERLLKASVVKPRDPT